MTSEDRSSDLSIVDSTRSAFEQRTKDPEVLLAVEYLLMRDLNFKVQDIASRWGYKDRGTIYDKLAKWRESGIMEEAEALYLNPKSEEIAAAVSKFVASWPLMLAKLENDILNGKSAKTRLEAMAWAKTNIIDPELAKREEPGAAESAYARRNISSSPTTITMPSFLKKTNDAG